MVSVTVIPTTGCSISTFFISTVTCARTYSRMMTRGKPIIHFTSRPSWCYWAVISTRRVSTAANVSTLTESLSIVPAISSLTINSIKLNIVCIGSCLTSQTLVALFIFTRTCWVAIARPLWSQNPRWFWMTQGWVYSLKKKFYDDIKKK